MWTRVSNIIIDDGPATFEDSNGSTICLSAGISLDGK